VNGARDALLEATKRPALRLLHRTRDGEALLVRLYLEAERYAERAAPWEPLPDDGLPQYPERAPA